MLRETAEPKFSWCWRAGDPNVGSCSAQWDRRTLLGVNRSWASPAANASSVAKDCRE